MSFTVAPVGRLAGADRDRFSAIYEASFPADERDDTDALVAGIEDGELDCHALRSGDDLVGLAITLDMEAAPIRYLEYLAVAPELRGGGGGGQLFDALVEDARRGGWLGVAFEVDRPEDAFGAERTIRRRRIAFYERHGAVVVPCAPRFRAPASVAKGMLAYTLMWLGDGPLAGELLARCVRGILVEGYGLAADDPLVGESIRALAC